VDARLVVGLSLREEFFSLVEMYGVQFTGHSANAVTIWSESQEPDEGS